MSSASPIDQYVPRSAGNGSADVSGQSDNGKSPLSMSLGFLKTLTEKKSTRVDGQPPKRRGPKPDSKPALTRRQELNRQAQRTHRERKELYITALEQEVLRLKENFTTVSRDKEAVAEENRQLKQLLAQHGIPWPGVSSELGHQSAGYTSSGSISGSYAPASSGYSPPAHTTHQFNANASPPSDGRGGRSMAQQPTQRGVDYELAGAEFVLTLEAPCNSHMEIVAERASQGGGPCGHALMASCPRIDFPEETEADVPFVPTPLYSNNGEGNKVAVGATIPALASLLEMCKTLNLDGQVTPVMAWGMILAHERFAEMTLVDFRNICAELGRKVRCYGFGAVLEEFEVRDALESVFYTESDALDGMLYAKPGALDNAFYAESGALDNALYNESGPLERVFYNEADAVMY